MGSYTVIIWSSLSLQLYYIQVYVISIILFFIPSYLFKLQQLTMLLNSFTKYNRCIKFHSKKTLVYRYLVHFLMFELFYLVVLHLLLIYQQSLCCLSLLMKFGSYEFFLIDAGLSFESRSGEEQKMQEEIDAEGSWSCHQKWEPHFILRWLMQWQNRV